MVSNELAPVEDLKKVFESLGVGDGTQVILYGERQGLWAARAWFTLDYLGHGDKAALLDGNIEKWRRENRPLTTDASPIKPAIFSPHVQPAALVTLPMMRDLSGQALNTTSRRRYSWMPAHRHSIEARKAHPTRRVPATSPVPQPLLDDHSEKHGKSADAYPFGTAPPLPVRRLAPGRRVVTYCHSGVQGAYAYFTAKYLGYDVALYDGSFQEWSNAAGTQVSKGR